MINLLINNDVFLRVPKFLKFLVNLHTDRKSFLKVKILYSSFSSKSQIKTLIFFYLP